MSARFGTVNFPIGAAIEPAATTDVTDSAILIKHYSSITAENAMKPDTIWPSIPGSSPAQPAAAPNFAPADTLVAFAAANQMRVRGHTLLWHATAPAWFFSADTSDPAAYRVETRRRLCQYISTVIARYPDIYAWDVVNEVATDEPFAANPYRTNSPWYQAYSVGGMTGAEYVRDAFLCADEARSDAGRNSSNMKLMLNDYNTELAGKRDNILRIVQSLINAGVPIDGVGHQFHLQINADVAQVTAALQAVENLNSGLVNHVTELDVSLYADPGECYAQRTIPPCLADVGTSPSQALLSAQALKYRALFDAFDRPSVTSVTFWGVADDHTWLNGFPVNRTNHPLLFDRVGNPKWAFWAVVDTALAVP